jgi:RNA recognition motif-containing protein
MHIYVANLSLNVIDSDLFMLFSAYGKVGYTVIVREINNGRSKGIAFVEMPLRAQARQAILAFYKMEIDDFKITVREIVIRFGEFGS